MKKIAAVSRNNSEKTEHINHCYNFVQFRVNSVFEKFFFIKMRLFQRLNCFNIGSENAKR